VKDLGCEQVFIVPFQFQKLLPLFHICKKFVAMLVVTTKEVFTKDGSFFVVFSLALLQLGSIILGWLKFEIL